LGAGYTRIRETPAASGFLRKQMDEVGRRGRCAAQVCTIVCTNGLRQRSQSARVGPLFEVAPIVPGIMIKELLSGGC